MATGDDERLASFTAFMGLSLGVAAADRRPVFWAGCWLSIAWNTVCTTSVSIATCRLPNISAENVEKVVDRFYDRIDDDLELRPIFPASMAVGRARQKLFLEEWLGGEPRYTTDVGPWQLRRRHAPFRVTEEGASRWIGHMEGALLDCGASAELASQIASCLRPVAFRMVNASDAD